MARFITHVKTSWSAGDAFDYMADLTNFAEWDPGVISSEQRSGDGPALNAAYAVEVKGVGGPLEMIYNITDYNRPNEFIAEAKTSLLHSLDRITVTPTDDGGSIVTYDAELTMNGLLGIADPLLGLMFKRIGQKAEEGLLRVLDGSRALSPEGRM